MSRRSWGGTTRLFFSGPAMTLIMASWRASMVMNFCPFRAESSAPSLMTFSRSAPVKPEVDWASTFRSTSSARGLFRAWTARTSSRPLLEAGHAVMHHCLASVDPVHQVTIVPRGQAGGMTISLPGEDRGYYSKRYMEEEIAPLPPRRSGQLPPRSSSWPGPCSGR